jgi:hypothetical protein
MSILYPGVIPLLARLSQLHITPLQVDDQIEFCEQGDNRIPLDEHTRATFQA